MKKLFLAVAAVMIVSGVVYATGDLLRTPGAIFNQVPIQQFAPTAIQSKTIGTKNAYKNFSTSSLTALKYQGLLSTPTSTAQALKVRVGGFVTGDETDYVVSTGDTLWMGLGVTKVGFGCFSTAGSMVNVQKM